MKQIGKIIIFSFLLLWLSGCSIISWIWKLVCEWAPDTDHCYQFTAIQSWNPDECEKIKWRKFQDYWSNPPKDKCYLTIAQNKQDHTICSKIKWWFMSYTKEECEKRVWSKILFESLEKDDINWCNKIKKIPNSSSTYNDCIWKLATKEKLDYKDMKIKELTKKIFLDTKDEKLKEELKKELDNLKKQKETIYNLMNDTQKSAYLKEQREKIMSWINDEEVKSEISKEFIEYKKQETNINKLLDKLSEITEKQKLIKKTDEKINNLTDKMKKQLILLVNDNSDKKELQKVFKDPKEWFEENWWKEINMMLSNMERINDRYINSSKAEDKITKMKYIRLKSDFDEIKKLYDNIDKINKLEKEWKIDNKKAKTLRWAVLLGKWIEFTTKYVPVFWWTISDISWETFEVVIDFAKKRAQRTTSLEKCFEDPENCDVEDITAY